MAPQADIERPSDDPFSLMGSNWPSESEGAYHAAELNADALSTATTTQAESADDAERKMASESGKTAEAVAGGYGAVAEQLRGQSRDYATISSWMLDAGGKVGKAKSQIADLVSSGTQDIRDALTCELKGTPASPSSNDLIARYRSDIASVASKLSTDLDAIGHSLSGDPGASRTPTYVSVPTTPSIEHSDPHAVVAAFNHGDQPAVELHQLPPMPRATTITNTESPSTTSTPAAPATTHAVNPILSNLISGGQSVSPSGSPTTPSAKSPSTPASAPAGQGAQAHQTNEQHQAAKSPVLPHIPSIPLPDAPAVAESIATAVTSAAGHQLPTSTAPTAPGSSAPTGTGFTPGVSGTPPMTPTAPAGLTPIGGGLPTPPPVMQPATPVVQATPASPPPGVQTPSAPQQSPAPRGPVADLAWIQKSYGLAPGLDLPKSENHIAPMLFIADLPEPEAHLHRVLATLRHQFDQSNWSQLLAVATIHRGLETRTVYATADGLSLHPQGVLLPHGVIPLDEMTSIPSISELSGSLMVTEKLTTLIPRGWTVEQVLSTVPGGETSQSAEEYQQLVASGELLTGKDSRGRADVTDDEALRVFARAAIGSAGCGGLDTESARIRASRWVGTQPTGYLDVLARWYLADAAEQMSMGNWGEAVWASEKYMSVQQSEKQAA